MLLSVFSFVVAVVIFIMHWRSQKTHLHFAPPHDDPSMASFLNRHYLEARFPFRACFTDADLLPNNNPRVLRCTLLDRTQSLAGFIQGTIMEPSLPILPVPFLYVDRLVIRQDLRKQGHARNLIRSLIAKATAHNVAVGVFRNQRSMPWHALFRESLVFCVMENPSPLLPCDWLPSQTDPTRFEKEGEWIQWQRLPLLYTPSNLSVYGLVTVSSVRAARSFRESGLPMACVLVMSRECDPEAPLFEESVYYLYHNQQKQKGHHQDNVLARCVGVPIVSVPSIL